jgi:hypothetical protein
VLQLEQGPSLCRQLDLDIAADCALDRLEIANLPIPSSQGFSRITADILKGRLAVNECPKLIVSESDIRVGCLQRLRSWPSRDHSYRLPPSTVPSPQVSCIGGQGQLSLPLSAPGLTTRCRIRYKTLTTKGKKAYSLGFLHVL